MKQSRWLLCLGVLLSLPAWGQSGAAPAPKSHKPATAAVHKMPRHAARQFSVRERQEQALMQSEQRRQAKLAKKQRKEAMKRSRHMRKTQLKNQ
jgi:hypothetical protein